MYDIPEMYLRIEVAPGDRPHLPFLWRVLNQDERPTEYEFNRVDFGLNSSSFQAQFVVKTHTEKLRDEFPMGAEKVLKSSYKEESMDSVANDDQGVRLYEELNELWSECKFTSGSQILPKFSKGSQLKVEHQWCITVLGHPWWRHWVLHSYQKSCLYPQIELFWERSSSHQTKFSEENSKGILPNRISSAFHHPSQDLQEMRLVGMDWDNLLQT